MRNEKIAWGLILLSLGSVLLLKNLGFIGFNWYAVFRLWPIAIIVTGLNVLLPATGLGRVISLLVSATAIAFVIYTGIASAGSGAWRSVNHWENKRNRVFQNTVSQEYIQTIKRASLTIEGGAVNYRMDDPADEHLFFAEAETDVGPHRLTHTNEGDSVVRLYYGMEGTETNFGQGRSKNNVDIRLHKAPVWDVTLQMGAGTADFDLADFTLSGFRLECGAASVKARLGDPFAHSTVHVESGAASIKLSVPRSAACKILVNSALSSRSLKGFTKYPDGSFRTEDYQETGDRYTIHLNGGVSSFKVTRYDD